jgi:hypothetical protein
VSSFHYLFITFASKQSSSRRAETFDYPSFDIGARPSVAQQGACYRVASELQNEGGMTGYRDLYRTGEDRANAIKRELDPYAWMNNGLGKSSLLAEHSRFPWLRMAFRLQPDLGRCDATLRL